MTAWVSSCCDTVTGRTATVLSGCTTKTNVPFGPRCTAAVGATTTCSQRIDQQPHVDELARPELKVALGNSALSLIVPVV